MGDKVKFKVKELYNIFGTFLLCFIFFFETQIVSINPQMLTFLQVVVVLCFTLALSSNGKIILPTKVYPFLLVWILMLPFFLYGFLHSEAMVVFRICFGILICLLLSCQDNWLDKLLKLLIIFSGSAVFFTFLFWLFPELYRYVVDFYGYFPPGTGQLKYGYRAGITAHYSQNGIFIALFLMQLIISIITKKKCKNKFINRLEFLIIIFAFLSFLLNGKRGTLVWCIVSIVLTWFITTEKKSKFITRFVIIGCLSIVLLQITIENIPSLNFVFERFSELGSDSSSSERFEMWGLAFLNFLRSPLLGIGFMNFREQYSMHLAYKVTNEFIDISSYRRLDAHNVYVQVLCEMGLIGFFMYILAVILLLRYTIRALKYFSEIKSYHYKYAASLSFCLQIFYLLYSLSGNCLYDLTFYLYIFAMAITALLNNRIDNRRLR